MTKLMAKEFISMLMGLFTMVTGETTSSTDSDMNSGLMAHLTRVNTMKAEDMVKELLSGKIAREHTKATLTQTKFKATVRFLSLFGC